MIPECKIYSDGSSFIAIPPMPQKPRRLRSKAKEPLIDVVDNSEIKEPESVQNDTMVMVEKTLADWGLIEVTDEDELSLFDWVDGVGQEPTPIPIQEPPPPKEPKGRLMTRKELFNELYKTTLYMKSAERKKTIMDGMRPYFKTENGLKAYVSAGIERKRNNLIKRRVLLARKIYLHESWNYFCTFTYDDKKHDEFSFKQKLRNCLSHFAQRKGWSYIGVWERSPKKNRLHFHALMDIPDGTMPGEIIEVKDYSPIKKEVQTTHQNTYFNDLFGRSDFKTVNSGILLGKTIQYLIKYIEKTGERIVYSKGLYAYIISDINEKDILGQYNSEDKPPKYLLFPEFELWDEGVYMGQATASTIKLMRKSN